MCSYAWRVFVKKWVKHSGDHFLLFNPPFIGEEFMKDRDKTVIEWRYEGKTDLALGTGANRAEKGLGCAGSFDYPQVATQEALKKHRCILIDLLGSGYIDKPDNFGYTVIWKLNMLKCPL